MTSTRLEKIENCKTWRVIMAAAMCAGMAVGLAGCNQQYANVPEVPSARGLAEDPNKSSSEGAMVVSLQYVANRYAPSTLRYDAATAKEAGELKTELPMVINLPRGQRKSFYERIARKVGPNVVPMTPDVSPTLPVYHVTRVWLRFSEGWVDVMRPMPELPPGPDGKPVYQTVTLKLKGGVGPWRIVHARAWTPGMDPVPEPYYMPETDRINEFDYTVRGREPITNRPLWDPQVEGNSGAAEVSEPVVVPATTNSSETGTSSQSGPTAVPAQPAQQEPPPVDLPDDGPAVQPR